jgi:quercetin dioxygenase-like cupin family protein
MNGRIFNTFGMLPSKGITYRDMIFNAKNHEIHLWRVIPGEWIYPHTHPHTDDIWYIVQGGGEYYTTSKEKKTVRTGEIAVASPGDVHGIFNSGSEDIVILSLLSPLPVDTDQVSGFEYPA